MIIPSSQVEKPSLGEVIACSRPCGSKAKIKVYHKGLDKEFFPALPFCVSSRIGVGQEGLGVRGSDLSAHKLYPKSVVTTRLQ